MEGNNLPDEIIFDKIYLIRRQKVMLDRDLADLYGVETKLLKRAVRRNIGRFPDDFMFELIKEEYENLRCQIGTSSWGGIRYYPMAFTEQGVAMLSSVLRSNRAINVNIRIIRLFVKMRHMLKMQNLILKEFKITENKIADHDKKIILIFKYLKQLEQKEIDGKDFKKRKRIGFKK